ncbi:hypothetical protein PL321_04560 [Caloramator sp. mosi_1]|uniref:hypothetical protein n=1 Tax=Caloramator sp. mosi_1 TaxID=3023090 RepID=UPI00235E1C46|nr:hypothetical protein [Caloramator sp. mosi_1]WDC84879.1 hypothetical protein PL321_04560 [Caloramator sp. mosi_1]
MLNQNIKRVLGIVQYLFIIRGGSSKKNIRYALRHIAKQYNQDIKEIKYKCNRITDLGKLSPIALSSDCILVPVKVRTPRVHRDGGYGYINLYFVEQVCDNFILLNNGSKIFL